LKNKKYRLIYWNKIKYKKVKKNRNSVLIFFLCILKNLKLYWFYLNFHLSVYIFRYKHNWLIFYVYFFHFFYFIFYITYLINSL
jgi:hypothetical protein